MQARRAARELALLSLPQMPTQPQNLCHKTYDDLVSAVVRVLTEESKDLLEQAQAELQKTKRMGDDHLETALRSLESAINHTYLALEFPLTLQLGARPEIRDYAIQLLTTIHSHREEIHAVISAALVKWELHRLPQIDRDLLRLATAEILYLHVPKEVAINEAVELAKRYSSDDGYRFINAILRKIGTDAVPSSPT
jgi:N utilization substance protein B